MLILVGVTVTVSLNGGLFEKAREGTYDYKVETVKENLANHEIDYYLETGHEIKDEVKEAIAKISIETGIDADKFIVWHDEIAIKKNKEGSNYPEIYIFYDWNKASLDDIKYLEEMPEDKKKEIDGKIGATDNKKDNIYLLYNRCFIYDFNGDGYFNQNDTTEMINFLAGDYTRYLGGVDTPKYPSGNEKFDYYHELLQYHERAHVVQVGDVSGAGRIDVADEVSLRERLEGIFWSTFYEEQIDADADKKYPYYVRASK